ncbi:hypothetical protein K2173_011828 [Erythroxylum novogranatense]|uniref:Kri1-like C-terminal domain-containing protein n=1 Tax=Erythroxylum novogranatense TaxID=1862640 RepID=A0AAV8SMC2_9ROSI|nr:hypothetical protein K2173_011828 [Erythroxylum novogranatense]
MGLKLFDDGDAAASDISKIQVDKEFARRYEHNKKREDLQRYEELRKKGLIDDSKSDSGSGSESSSDEYDFEEDIDVTNPRKTKDMEFFKNLLKVRNRDPSIYQNVSLFHSDSGEDEEEDGENNKNKKKEKGKKAVYLKDVVAQHLIEEGPEFDEVEPSKGKTKTYNEEQDDIKNALLDALKDDEDDGEEDFLRVKDKSNEIEGADIDDGELKEKLGEYFGQEEELDENGMFLKDFFLNKMWVDKRNKDDKGFDEVDELLKDEEEIEKQEEYEMNFFRHQEDAGDRIMGHSRKIEGSVRKKDNARKEQRKSKEERTKFAEMERKEELKHLKNLKKKEMQERMKRIMLAAGAKGSDDCPLDLGNLEEEFDPQKYDKMMEKAFNDEYYDAEDIDPHYDHDSDDDEGEIEKPDFDKEDELLGLAKGWDELDFNGGFLAARERSLKRKAENGEVENDQYEFHEEERDGSMRKRKRKMSLVKKVKEEMMEEYYKLDYEGTIGDLKTRFKYAKVKRKRYGLKAHEILMLDDKDLNQYVSVKKLAPYREKEWKVPNNKRQQIKELVRGKLKNEKSVKKNKKLEQSSNDLGDLSRNAKRRRRKAELKLSHSRLLAYGKVQPKSKNKREH